MNPPAKLSPAPVGSMTDLERIGHGRKALTLAEAQNTVLASS